MMLAGRLTERITIQHETEGRGGIGGTTRTWSTFKERWAHKMPSRGSEAREQAANQASQAVTWRLRWFSGVTEAMRVLENADSSVYLIHSVVNVGNKDRVMELVTTRERITA